MFLAESTTAASIELLTTIISLVVTLIPTLAGLIVTCIKLFKNKDWNKVKDIADAVMKEVEAQSKEVNMTSEKKLTAALEAIQKALIVAGITFDDKTKERTKEYIEQCIRWFNQMSNSSK